MIVDIDPSAVTPAVRHHLAVRHRRRHRGRAVIPTEGEAHVRSQSAVRAPTCCPALWRSRGTRDHRSAPDGHADEPRLRVNTFPNAKALALHAGIAKGIFEKRGFKIELHLTENSRSQREGLAAGKFDIVHSAVDNALAMIEVGKQDVVIVTGGDSGMNEFFVQAEIKSFADLRGRTLVVDAPDTAYALQAKKILAPHGLKDGADYTVKPVGAGVYRFKAMAESKDNAAAILNLPFTVQAEQLGMRSLGRTIDLLGPYQAGGAFAMRAGRASMARRSNAISPPISKRCDGSAIPTTARRTSRCWWRS